MVCVCVFMWNPNIIFTSLQMILFCLFVPSPFRLIAYSDGAFWRNENSECVQCKTIECIKVSMAIPAPNMYSLRMCHKIRIWNFVVRYTHSRSHTNWCIWRCSIHPHLQAANNLRETESTRFHHKMFGDIYFITGVLDSHEITSIAFCYFVTILCVCAHARESYLCLCFRRLKRTFHTPITKFYANFIISRLLNPKPLSQSFTIHILCVHTHTHFQCISIS